MTDSTLKVVDAQALYAALTRHWNKHRNYPFTFHPVSFYEEILADITVADLRPDHQDTGRFITEGLEAVREAQQG